MSSRDPLSNAEPLIRRVYAYVAYRIGDGPEAEDVVGDVFERALRYRDAYDARRGEPLAWLIGIARRVLAAPRPVHVPLPEGVEAEPAVHRTLEDDTLRRLELRAAVAALTDTQRELIALRYGADLTARQIGDLLELRTNAVEVALHRALGTLRRRLEGLSTDVEPGTSARALPERLS